MRTTIDAMSHQRHSLKTEALTVMAAARLVGGSGLRGQLAPVKARYQWTKMRLASHMLSDQQRRAYELSMKQALAEMGVRRCARRARRPLRLGVERCSRVGAVVRRDHRAF